MSNIEFKDAFSRYTIGAEVEFAEVIELVAGNSYSAPVSVDGPLELTIAPAPAAGARYRGYFIADGTNAPTIVGAYQHGGSSGYDDTAGAINLLELWHDGLSLIYTWSQFESAEPVLLLGAEISAADRTVLTLTFSEAIDDGSVPAPADFTLTNTAGADPVTDVAISGSTVLLTRTRSESNSAVRLSYAKGINPLKSDVSGDDAMAFVGRSVTFEPEV